MQWNMNGDRKQADTEHKCCACLHTSNEASNIHIDGIGMKSCPRYQFYCAECVCRCAQPLTNATIWNVALGKRVPVFEEDGRTLARTWVPPVRAVERGARTEATEPADWMVTAKQTLAEIKLAAEKPKWPVCATCTFENAPGVARCEMCGTAAPAHTWPDLTTEAAAKLMNMGFGTGLARAAAAATAEVLRKEHDGRDVAHDRVDAIVDRIVKRSVERLVGSGAARPWAPCVPVAPGVRVARTAGARGKTKTKPRPISASAAAATTAASATAARRSTRPGLNREDLGPGAASEARGATAAATQDATSMLQSLQRSAEMDAWLGRAETEEQPPPRSSVRGERIAPGTSRCCDACGEVDVWLVQDATPGSRGEVYCEVCWDDTERSEAAELAACLGELAKREAAPTILEAAAAAAMAAAVAEAAEVAVAAEAAEAAAVAVAADESDDEDDEDDEDWVDLDAEAESDGAAVAGAGWEHALVDLSMLGSAPAAPLSEPRGGAEAAGLARHRQRMGVRSIPVHAARPAEGLGSEGEGEGGAEWEVLSVAGSEACTEFSQCTEHTEAFSEAHTEAWEDEYAAPEASPPSAAARALESVDEGVSCTSWAERVRTLGAAPATAARPARAAHAAGRRQRAQQQQPRRQPKMVVAPKRERLPRWSEVAFVTR